MSLINLIIAIVCIGTSCIIMTSSDEANKKFKIPLNILYDIMKVLMVIGAVFAIRYFGKGVTSKLMDKLREPDANVQSTVSDSQTQTTIPDPKSI